MNPNVRALVTSLGLEEKAALTAGADKWSTAAVPRLGVPSLTFSDGPAGARGATAGWDSLTPSVCIPSGTALGATWDPSLVARASAVVARQALEKGARVLLAPTVNLHRHPLWGRNFEAFSEDPLLTAKLAVAYIKGVQAEGVAATVKHFVCNEAEFERFTSSSDVDERALRECYLLPFEYAVRCADVACLMTSYNRVNGDHVPNQRRLLQGILRDEWGFGGVVMTDWWGMLVTERAAEAGLDLEMPGPGRSFGAALARAVSDGTVPELDLDAKVTRLLALIDRVGLLDHAGQPLAGYVEGEDYARPAPQEHPQDRAEDRAVLRQAAAASVVLLANDGILPIGPAPLSTVALVGPRSEHPGIMGGGSARVTPHYRLSFRQALQDRLGPSVQVVHEKADNAEGVAVAVALAASADMAIVVVGTDDAIESEHFDRETMDLPGRQDDLVRQVTAANPRTVVVVASGAPVTMSWASQAAGLVQSFFAGQETANALVDVLVGDAEPGGRLPMTIPLHLGHTPAYGNFPGEISHVRYGEGLLIGYRWYDTRHLPVAFPFGHGLSYTKFEIDAPKVSTKRLGGGERARVEVRVRNTGDRRGAEVLQCYVAPPDGGTALPNQRFRPVKELRAFAKVWLGPGESQTVLFELGERSFAYWDPADEDWAEMRTRQAHRDDEPPPSAHRRRPGWYVWPGQYELLIARSAADVVHRLAIAVEGGDDPLDGAMMPD
jgi:beta-glucosidase